jgi:hypothetical protein
VGGKVIVRSLASYQPIFVDTLQYTEPTKRSLFALDEETGKESIVLKQQSLGHDGTQPPPSVTRDGLLVVQYYSTYRPGGNAKNGGWSDPVWTLEDMKTQEAIMPLLETEKCPPEKTVPSRYLWGKWYAGPPGSNENYIASVIGDMVMSVHALGFYGGAGQFTGGSFDLVIRRWYVDGGGFGWTRIDPKKELGWISYGGDGNESGGSDAMSAADGLLYHSGIHLHRITCYEPMQPLSEE